MTDFVLMVVFALVGAVAMWMFLFAMRVAPFVRVVFSICFGLACFALMSGINHVMSL